MQTRTIAITAAGVVALGIGAAFLATTVLAPAQRLEACTQGRVAGGAIGGPFTLIDEEGQTVTDADVIDGPTLIYFGYTFCPDVCPLDTVRSAEALDILVEEGRDVDFLFISVDPGRDTPEVLREFTGDFHPNMIGLTGTEEQIAEAARNYRVVYEVHDDEGDEFYLVDHMTFTYYVTPDDGFVDFFRRDMGPEQMAETVGCFIDAGYV